jgi:hypothetical protein
MKNYCIYCGAELQNKNSDACQKCLADKTISPRAYYDTNGSPSKSDNGVSVKPGDGIPGKTFAYIGIICAVASIIILPIVFGPLAIFFGYVSITKGERDMGWIAILLGIVLASISFLIAFLLAISTYQ